MSTNKNKPQNKEFDLNQEKLRNVENEKNHKSGEIESLEKNKREKNLNHKDKGFKNIHKEPADEQQFEINNLDYDNTK
jgi:hypothetical protein